MNTLWSRHVYRGKVVDLRVDEVEFGGERPRRSLVEIVEHRGAVVVAAQPTPDSIVLVEQYRYPLGLRQWEVPAGTLDPGEDPELAAARELREETGYRAARVRKLWSAFSAPGFCTELLHFYAAEGLEAGEREPDEGEEDMLVRTFSLDEAWALVERDRLRDAKTQIAIAWALRALRA
ncbi:MAG: NUDIX hydrolase [Candidatus Eremiobacteraeota bacterium]|nr:NUDIX hydrolase [Candidatus Eremiobacteraeota bacterium]